MSFVYVNIKSTGGDPQCDRIVVIAVVRDGEQRQWWLNPEAQIPSEVAELIGISDADVQGLPTFFDVAADVFKYIAGHTLVGFGCHQMDVPLLAESFARCGITWTGWRDAIDAGELYRILAPRTLTEALQEYCGRSHDQRHSALADAIAIRDVFTRQLELYELAGQEIGKFSCHRAVPADPFGQLIYNDVDQICFGTNRNMGVPVAEELGYARWMLDHDFPASTKQVLRAEIEFYEGLEDDDWDFDEAHANYLVYLDDDDEGNLP